LKSDMKVSSDGGSGVPPPPLTGMNQAAAVVAALQSAQAAGVVPNGVVPIEQQNANVNYRIKVY